MFFHYMCSGWTGQATIREMPVSTAMAGVVMRLNPGGIRELHWHIQAEWGLMLTGSARITAVDQNGKNFIHDVFPGQTWYFPEGIPHSIQGLSNGAEFILVFDDGSFNEDSTFLLSDWLTHIPPEVLSKNFQMNMSAFQSLNKGLTSKDYYIFAGAVPGNISSDTVTSPYGSVAGTTDDYFYDLLGSKPVLTNWGSVRVQDSTKFPVADRIAAALVEIVPGGIRELHWHPIGDEWQYIISGYGRMTVFGSGANSRTYDLRPGTVGYVPSPHGHYIENTGTTVLRYVEVFASNIYSDVSLKQWLALTPVNLVQAHLNLTQEGLNALANEKIRTPVDGGHE
jgi:oxalate decarboxylase